MAQISVIGSGFAGLSAACFLAKEGHNVTVFEKNDSVGGRARVYTENGFRFDMGPSWYWMPDVFEKFFGYFGKTPQQYYDLVKLDPGFQMIFSAENTVPLPADIKDIYNVFEEIEPGSAKQLAKFLLQAELKYKVGMGSMVYKPCDTWLEFANMDVIMNAPRMQLLTSMKKHVRSFFKDERLVALMEFPVLFLGAMADRIPALYSMMNYSALTMGTWYPMGGMCEIITAMEKLALSLGVTIKLNAEVTQIVVKNNRAIAVDTKVGTFAAQAVVATGDYNHVEQQLLEKQYRNYTAAYWDKKIFAPSCLIFYLGVNKKIKKLIHHNLIFDTSLDKHASEIYEQPRWPSDPLFYVCAPSKTDKSVATKGQENLFILMPVAPGLEDTDELRERYFDIIMNRLEQLCVDTIKDHIVYKRSYCINDFKADYHAYKGNAYGLANTLSQTAVLKPSLRNKVVENLFYAGQLTVPGPGVPPALISGQIAAEQLLKTIKTTIL